MVNERREPPPGIGSCHRMPPWSATRFRDRLRPSPSPARSLVMISSPGEKASSRAAWILSLFTPVPRSVTCRVTPSSSPTRAFT